MNKYPNPDQSPLKFRECRYLVLIKHLALPNVSLDNTAALRKKVFYVCFVETKFVLSYGSFLSTYAIIALANYLPCVSR